jgi:hypothetical protein
MLVTIILWLLGFLVVAAIALLIVPIWVRLQVTTKPHFSFHCDAAVFMRLAPRIKVFSSTGKKAENTVAAQPKQTRKRDFSNPRLVGAAPRLIADVFRHLHLVLLRVDVEYGLEDPSDTGQLAGVLLPLTYADHGSSKVEIAARPNFRHSCFEGEVTAIIRLTLLAFVLPFARFAWRVVGPGR